MARYIDADKLSKEVLASWDKDNHRTLEASQVHRQEHCHLMRIIEKQPIADVVPKSEVAKIITTIKGNFEIGYGGVCEFNKLLDDIEKKYAKESGGK